MATSNDFIWANCPVCASPDHRGYVSFSAVEFVECTNCGVIYKSRERSGALAKDFYEQGYFQGRKSGREKRFEHRSRKAASWILDALEILKEPAKGVRLLDVGCSLGYVLEGAKRLGLSSAGVDISEYAVKLCIERGYEAKVGRVDELPYPPEEFDVVVLKHVLEHTPQPTVALAELRRVLNPDGVVLIAVPDLRYWKGDLLRRTYRYFRPDDLGAQHYVYYTAKTLSRLLETNGFVVRHTSKAVFRNRQAALSPAHRLWEILRFEVLRAWVALSSSLRLQREVYLLASKT